MITTAAGFVFLTTWTVIQTARLAMLRLRVDKLEADLRERLAPTR